MLTVGSPGECARPLPRGACPKPRTDRSRYSWWRTRPQDALEALLTAGPQQDDRLTLAPGEPVAFYLDQGGFPEWQPMTFDEQGFHLAVAPGCGVVFIDGSVQPGFAVAEAVPRR